MENEEAISWHLQINGLVQGIGFRPHVFLIARAFGLKGNVRNDIDGLHIHFNAPRAKARKFKHKITIESPPRLAKISSVVLRPTAFTPFSNFEIIDDHSSAVSNLMITPDIALCSDCRQDLYDLDERRNNYAFTSCSQCGPRFSIMNHLPYDRCNTEMSAFSMCTSCIEEYEHPSNRRFFAQTNSCPNCAINLTLNSSDGVVLSKEKLNIVEQVSNLWEAGKIIAIKGIGGYLLTCDAANATPIQEIRNRKNRPTKPLAIMIPNSLDVLKGVSDEQKDMMQGPVAPIVLVPSIDSPISLYVNERHDRLGVMLPYVPLFELLLNKFNRPIVATSANISGAPIVFNEDIEGRSQLEILADYVLTNNREIAFPQDDSVIQFSRFHQKKIILRRSRGLAPSYFNSDLVMSDKSILTMGAHVKSSFGILHENHIHISQYLGDLDDFDTKENYKVVLDHFCELLAFTPEVIICDQHKEYGSSKYGMSLAQKGNIPIQFVQHHKAHFSAILGEHNLLDEQGAVLGVVWDGAGLGEDGHIWGSELFIYKNYSFDRVGHLSNFEILLKDKMAREPRLSALSLCHTLSSAESILKSKFTEPEFDLYSKLLKRGSEIQTTSMGRLFDGVASILDILNVQTFEGEAAIQLEQCAVQYFTKYGLNSLENGYDIGQEANFLKTQMLMKQILMDLKIGSSIELIAAKFHFTLVQWIEMIARQQDCHKIAFSGGVFQNSLLVDLLIERLEDSYKLYFHDHLSPNDENISFGQLIYHEILNKREKYG